jgi:hypothetical protein
MINVSDAIEGGIGGVSTARCGDNVVVGFADAEPNNPNSYDGVAVSKNGGKSFRDLGTLPVPTPAVNSGFGPYVLGVGTTPFHPAGNSNPTVACAGSNLFYYGSVYHTQDFTCGGSICTAIAVSTSTDGGQTWGLPVVANNQGEDTFEFVSPTLAVDPTNTKRLYLAYINWNISAGVAPDCLRIAYVLDVLASQDGGKTWLAQHVDHACDGGGDDPTRTGSLASPNITVSPEGNVYVAYEFVGQQGNPNQIRLTRSLDNANSFGAPLIVSTQATNNALPQLGVDRTTLGSRGTIYLTWSGSLTGTYTDTLISESVDSGLTFSLPLPISPAPSAGSGRFQTNSVLAVDNDGQVQACFYETPTNQPTNSSVYSYNCATSLNRGITWQVTPVIAAAPVGYDAVAADFSLHNDGFFTAFEVQTNGTRSVVGQSTDLQ